MPQSTRKHLYDIALNGQGFILLGTPENPAIRVEQQPVFDRRFAQGDRDFSDFSIWWYTAQRDFSGGVKDLVVWQDDGKYRGGRGVDTFSRPGKVGVLNGMTVVKDFGTTNYAFISAGAYDYVTEDEMILVGLRGKDTNTESAIHKSTDGSTFDDVTHGDIASNNYWQGVAIHSIMRMPWDSKFYICVSDGDWAFSTYDGTTHADITATVKGAETLETGQGLAVVGVTGFFAFYDGDELLIMSSTDGASYTKQITLAGAKWRGGIGINGNLVYLVVYETNIVELREYDIANDTDALVKRFIGKSIQNNINGSGRQCLINTLDGAKAWWLFDDGSVWSYDGTTVTEELKDTYGLVPSTEIGFGLVEHDGILFGPNIAIDPAGNIHTGYFDGTYDNILPLLSSKFSGNSAAVLMCSSDKATANQVVLYKNTGTGNVSTRLDISEIDGGIPSVDKMWGEITLFFDPFPASAAIEVQYSIDGGTTFTSLGTANEDDSTSITFRFGDAIVSKTMMLRLILSRGGSTPYLKSFSVKYLPLPHYKNRWTMVLNCTNNIILKDGKSREEKSGEHLRNLLRDAWWKREILSFEDTDCAAVDLDGALTAAATTIPLQEYATDFPEVGRVKIGDEEILYSGKQEKSLLSATRGSRGTAAAAHSDGDDVTMAYDVIVVDYREEKIVSNEANMHEYKVTMTLLEA